VKPRDVVHRRHARAFSHTALLADRRLGLDEMVEERSIARRAATLAAAAAGGGAAGAPHQPQQQQGSRLPPQSAGPEHQHGQPPQPHGQARYGGEQFGDQQCALPLELPKLQRRKISCGTS